MKLETERLILRDWNESDIDDLIEGLNNFEVSKWLAYVPYPYTREDAKKWIDFCNQNTKKLEKEIHMILPLYLNLGRK